MAVLPRHMQTRLQRRTRSSLVAAANKAWGMSLRGDALAYRRATRKVADTQARLLRRLLHQNIDSDFGRRFRFDSMSSVEDYRAGVPLSTYETYQDDIERIAKGAQGVLTSEPVILLEPTSGSTGPTKLIPYTRSLKAEFQRAIAPWIVDMLAQHPGVQRGQSYWSVSPIVRRDEYSDTCIPVGFEDDSEYLGSLGRRLVQTVLAVPSTVRLIEDVDSFRYVTLLFLLRSRDLSMISIWHPTFLTLLLEPMIDWLPQLAGDIATGRITFPSAASAELAERFDAAMRPDPERASEIEACNSLGCRTRDVISALWPRLCLISCWGDGNARPHLPTLTSLFPNAAFQPKGLVSTEGIVSIPTRAQSGGALAVRSHFFEFLPLDAEPGEATVLAHELEHGRRYSVVITTGGGLYRYMTHDLVDVVRDRDSCPVLRFIGKESHVSDHYGEKLNSMHVQHALESALAKHDTPPAFAMVAFDDSESGPAYALFVESNRVSDQSLISSGREIENALRQNYHYDYCRDLGQLAALKVFRIEGGAQQVYVKVCQANGQRIGGLKPSALNNLSGWSRSFSGRFLNVGDRFEIEQ